MGKKKWYECPKTILTTIAAIIVAVTVIWNWVSGAVDFFKVAEVTKAIAAEQKETDKRVSAIERYIDINQAILENNQKNQQYQQQQYQRPPYDTVLPVGEIASSPQPYCVPDETGILWCFDEQTWSWYKAQP